MKSESRDEEPAEMTLTAQALTMTEAPGGPETVDPEAAFVQRLVAGDEAAFHHLYRQHAGDVFRLASRFVHSDAEAEEVVQEVFIAAFRYVDRFRGQSRLKTWLYRITVNRALKRQRWWRRRREVGPERLPQRAVALPPPDVRVADRQALDIVASLLEGLESRKRTVLILHELEGLDTQQIAEILGCPRSTVLTRLSRARHEVIRRARKAGVSLEESEP